MSYSSAYRNNDTAVDNVFTGRLLVAGPQHQQRVLPMQADDASQNLFEYQPNA